VCGDSRRFGSPFSPYAALGRRTRARCQSALQAARRLGPREVPPVRDRRPTSRLAPASFAGRQAIPMDPAQGVRPPLAWQGPSRWTRRLAPERLRAGRLPPKLPANRELAAAQRGMPLRRPGTVPTWIRGAVVPTGTATRPPAGALLGRIARAIPGEPRRSGRGGLPRSGGLIGQLRRARRRRRIPAARLQSAAGPDPPLV
jgi:hypothetical protein